MHKISDTEINKLKRQFRHAKPFQHIILRKFLVKSMNIFDSIKKEKFIKKDSDLFSFKQTNNLFYSKNKTIKAIVDLFLSKEFSSLISKISGIKLRQGSVDIFGSLYEKTDYLLCHDDRVEDRKVAFILYLSKTFSENYGGVLALYSNKGKHPYKKIIAYPPIENSLVIFKVSRVSWHEVEEVLSDKKRYAIGGWLH